MKPIRHPNRIPPSRAFGGADSFDLAGLMVASAPGSEGALHEGSALVASGHRLPDPKADAREYGDGGEVEAHVATIRSPRTACRLSGWMAERFLSYRASAYALAWDCLRAVFARDDRSWWARLFCLAFIGLIIALPVTLLLAQKTDARLGSVVIFGVTALAWAAVIQAPSSRKRRAVADGRPINTARVLLWIGVVSAIELTLIIPPVLTWWNHNWPDSLRAVAWGIILPIGWLDLMASLLALVLAAFDGYPIYRGR